jgi:hypothetical protein
MNERFDAWSMLCGEQYTVISIEQGFSVETNKNKLEILRFKSSLIESQ